MKKIIGLLFCLGSISCYGQVITINENDKVINLASQAFFIKDKTRQFSIYDIMQPKVAAQFQKLDKPFINFGITSSAIWIKCTIRNETTDKLIIELGNTTLYDVQFYEFDSLRLLKMYHTGNWLPY